MQVPDTIGSPKPADLAARLLDVADAVAKDAEAATAAIRALTDQAHQIADLAASLSEAASRLGDGIDAQLESLTHTRTELAVNRSSIMTLEQVPDRLAAIAQTMERIAAQSRLLSLNARIEASRGSEDNRGIAAVVGEMVQLSDRTRAATDEVALSAAAISSEVRAARAIVASQDDLTASHANLIATARANIDQQHRATSALQDVAAAGAERVDAAASLIGRVGASAVAVRLLSRQIGRLVAPAEAG